MVVFVPILSRADNDELGSTSRRVVFLRCLLES
jgi:hypothetical protein